MCVLSWCCSLLLLTRPGSDTRPACTHKPEPGEKPRQPYTSKQHNQRKQVDDVLGGAAAWENVDSTEVDCPQPDCTGARAYFMQLQIRSADEPMSIFYKCVACAHLWRVG